MTLLSPLSLALLLLVLPIALMYVLRLRRPERQVSSTLLWPRIVGDMQANAPWQRLHPSLLLLLQVLVVAAIVLALARPAFSRSEVVSRDEIVVIDESLSMRASDIAPDRFEIAQRRAEAIAQNLASGSLMSVIGMGSQPRLALAGSSSAPALRSAIESLTPDAAFPNTLAALSMAASLGRQGVSTEAIILTDHSGGLGRLPVSMPFPVRIVRLGGVSRDLGIVSFTASGGARTQALLKIHNFGLAPVHSDVELYADGQLADVRPIDLAPGAGVAESWDSLPAGIHTLRAHLTLIDDLRDDKTAWAVVGEAPRRRVLLVTRGDYFLQTALALDPSLTVQTMTPESYSRVLSGGYDAVVLDGTLPHAAPAVGTLIVNPPAGSLDGIRFAARTRAGSLSTVSGSPDTAGIMQYVDLSDAHVARLRQARLPGWLHPLAASEGTTAIAAGDSGAGRVALIAFAVQESDWPLRVSFPIAIRNLISYLAPTAVAIPGSVRIGLPVTLVPPAGTHQLLVVGPTNQRWLLSAPFAPFTTTGSPGVYTIRTPASASPLASFVANVFAPERPDVPGPDEVSAGRRTSEGSRTVISTIEFSWIVVLGAIGLLSVEWWAAFKR